MDTAPLPPRRRVTAVLALALFLALFLLTACSTGADRSAESPAHGGEADAAAPEPGVGVPEPGLGVPGAPGEEDGPERGIAHTSVDVSERTVIHTAELTVEADDVAATASAAKEAVLGAGGYVEAENLRTRAGQAPRAILTLRVPAEGYEQVLADLADLGTQSQLSREVEDVTEEVADVQSRVESAEASLEVLRGYLEEAENVEELLRVEEQINWRQEELEALQARREALARHTAFSTVRLELLPPETYLEERVGDSVGFTGGLVRGWRTLVWLGQGLAVALGWLLPFLPVAAVLAVPPLLWVRSRRRRAAASAGAPDAPGGGGASGGPARRGEPPVGGDGGGPGSGG